MFNAHDELCTALNKLAQETFFGGKPVLLRFEEVSSLQPSALLCLASSIQTARAYRGQRAITGTYPRDKVVERALQVAGFFSLLGVKHRIEAATISRNERWIEHISHNTCEGEWVEKLKERIFEDAEVGIDDAALAQIYVGLTEAMTNVVQHAYSLGAESRPRIDFVTNRWWITGRIDRFARRFVFAICDLGIGIPKTIAGKTAEGELKKILQFDAKDSISDGDLLRVALLKGESSTELPYRGRGLRQMRGVVDIMGGRIRVASGFASCIYAQKNFTATSHPVPFVGTLIEWVLPLDNVLAGEAR